MIKVLGVYSSEFITAVMDVWGDDPTMSTMLIEGDLHVGVLLHQEANKGFGAQEVVDASCKGRLADLVPQAQRRLKLRRLYELWSEAVRRTRSHGGGSSY